jgi:low temperature requirement protein LtrA
MEAAPIAEWNETKWSRLRTALFKERKVRQFYSNGVLVREPFLRKVEYEELLLDLCIVFNIAFLSHNLKASLDAGNIYFEIEKFALVLGLVFTAWRNNALRFNLLTTIGTDLMNKLEVLALVLAFTGIGSGAALVYKEFGRHVTALSGYIVLVLPSLVIIIGAWDSPLRHPKKSPFFNHAVFRGLFQLLCATPYVLICLAPVRYTKTLYYVGFFANFTLDLFVDLVIRHVFKNSPDCRFYAFCIETWTERHALLTLVSFGESTLSLLYIVDGLMRNEVTQKQAGSILLLICCLWLLLLAYITQYFEIDQRIVRGNGACHAVRRSVLSSIVWSLMHFTVIFGLVVLAVGYGLLLEQSFQIGSDNEHRQYIALSSTSSQTLGAQINTGLLITAAETVVSLSFVTLSLCHRSSLHEVTKQVRLGFRVAVTLAMLVAYWIIVGTNFTCALQWVYTAVQSVLTILEFAIVRMDACGWWHLGSLGDDSYASSEDKFSNTSSQ